MGRPIRKDKFVSSFGGDTSAKIAVSNYRTGGSNTASTTAYIVSQRGSQQFKIHLDDSTEVVMTLVTKATLDTNGTFNVKMVLDDSTTVFVSKFFNNTVHFTRSDGSHGSVPYTLGTDPTGDFQVESSHGVIDIVSE
jgi:hypothetical protein